MKCKDCKHWQGHSLSEWADCYRIVLALQPDLGCCYLSNDNGMVEKFFEVPFDPHDVKYWNVNPIWKKLYQAMTQDAMKEGVRVINETRDDIVYDGNGGERLGRLKLRYYQTHKDYDCKEEEDE